MTAAALGEPTDRLLTELCLRYPELAPCREALRQAIWVMTRGFRSGGKLLVCGNGGSAADAEHIVAELMKGFRRRRPLPALWQERLASCGDPVLIRLQAALPAIALSGASPLATAIANDLDAVLCFAQQVVGYGRAGDVFLGISTSGRARNVLAAARVAQTLELETIALTGWAGGELAALADVAIMVPATETPHVQELHQPVYHALCAAVEEEIFGRET